MNHISNAERLFSVAQSNQLVNDESPVRKVASDKLPINRSLLGPDTATVSQTAGALTTSLTSDDVRLAKVNQLRAAIASGTYKVDSSAVAGKLIDSMLGRS